MEDFRKSSGDSLGVLDPEVETEQSIYFEILVL
jgi:hypothetical protein